MTNISTKLALSNISISLLKIYRQDLTTELKHIENVTNTILLCVKKIKNIYKKSALYFVGSYICFRFVLRLGTLMTQHKWFGE